LGRNHITILSHPRPFLQPPHPTSIFPPSSFLPPSPSPVPSTIIPPFHYRVPSAPQPFNPNKSPEYLPSQRTNEGCCRVRPGGIGTASSRIPHCCLLTPPYVREIGKVRHRGLRFDIGPFGVHGNCGPDIRTLSSPLSLLPRSFPLKLLAVSFSCLTLLHVSRKRDLIIISRVTV
jgi:hypothetical protein